MSYLTQLYKTSISKFESDRNEIVSNQKQMNNTYFLEEKQMKVDNAVSYRSMMANSNLISEGARVAIVRTITGTRCGDRPAAQLLDNKI